MKKITLIIIFLLMIICSCRVIYASEANPQTPNNPESTAEQTEQSAPEAQATPETPETPEAQANPETPAVPENSNPETQSEQNTKKENEYFEVKAKVLEASKPKKVENGGLKDTVQEVKLEILEGEFDTEEFTTNYILSYDMDGKILAYELKKGDRVWVQLTKTPEGKASVEIENVIRQNYIYFMMILFLLSILLVGGKRGIKAIVGLVITILAVYFILIKGIFAGYNPISLSVLTSLIIIVLTFIIIGGGINKKIVTAAMGTFGGVLVAGIIASVFSYLLKLSGACEDSILLSANSNNLNFNFRDLIFAGIVISALGACMDVGMSIASSLDELRLKTKDMDWKELFKSGMNIGKDIIGTMANTLILAYVGSSLTLILLFMSCDFSFVQILNKETIAEEVISAIAGSMGVVYTVPITAFIYSFLNRDKTIYKTVSDNKVEGKRSLKI